MVAKRRSKKKQRINLFKWLIIILLILLAWFFRNDFKRLFIQHPQGTKSIAWYQNQLSGYSIFGVDVSEYQENIDWQKLTGETTISFVFIRATAGNNKLDKKFKYNWEQAHNCELICGAYHYYRPDENSLEQVANFTKYVDLKTGDLPPVVDIEKFSNIQSVSSLKTGVLRFLNAIELHYNVTPILYTYHHFYAQQIVDDERFDKYPLWIARYNISENSENIAKDWKIWQFTDNGNVPGIKTAVDINVFCCNKEQLNALRIK
jgi:lysozyme